MAETSRSQVTITLGRSGQVVKRAGAVLDSEICEPISPAVVGSKRSVKDRLGPTVDALEIHNKRLRGDNGRWNLKAGNYLDDLHLGKDDLRFKIMKRTESNRLQNMVDLRDMLSRSARPSTANPVTSYSMHESSQGRRRVSEPRDNPRHMPEPRHERQSMPEPRGDRPRGPVSRDDRPHGHMSRDDRPREPLSRDDRPREPLSRDDRPRGPFSRDDRQRMAESMDGRQGMPEPHEVRNRAPPKLNDARPRISERPVGSLTGQYAPLRTSEGPPRGFVGDSYSPWTLDHIRRKSPDRVLNTRGLSPQRRRAYEDSRSVAYGSRDASEISRPVPSTSFLTKQSLSGGPMKSVGATPLAGSTLPPCGNTQRSQYQVEPLTVEGFLRSLGLEKYLISFKVEEVDMSALSQMGDQDLKELGIPMGPRKKILLALVARSRRQAR